MAELHEMYDEAERLKDEGHFDQAVAKLEAILAADESYALAHAALAVLMTRLKRFDDAIRHAQRVCVLEPNDPFSFTALSVTYQRAYAGTNDHRYIHAAEDAMARARQIEQHH
jgi:tetratricopeptide (TPR) repeat protein